MSHIVAVKSSNGEKSSVLALAGLGIASVALGLSGYTSSALSDISHGVNTAKLTISAPSYKQWYFASGGTAFIPETHITYPSSSWLEYQTNPSSTTAIAMNESGTITINNDGVYTVFMQIFAEAMAAGQSFGINTSTGNVFFTNLSSDTQLTSSQWTGWLPAGEVLTPTIMTSTIPVVASVDLRATRISVTLLYNTD
jgi:hypothetical protein